MIRLGIILFCLSNLLYLGNSNFIRKNERILNRAIVSDRIKCTSFNNSCICPAECLDLDNNGYCIVKKCWEWSGLNNSCFETGPSYTNALVWQSIPFTGIFGAGFGNMGRWDLFAYGSIIWGVGTILPCILLCIYMFTFIDVNPIKVFKIYVSLFSCIVLAYYIWGIYLISNKIVRDSNGCKLINT